MRVNIITNLKGFGSLPYVARITGDILKRHGYEVIYSHMDGDNYRDDCINLLIEATLPCIIHKRKADIWWTDDPAMLPLSYMQKEINSVNTDELFTYNYAVSEFNKRFQEEYLNLRVDGVIYRPINKMLFNYQTSYDGAKYDLFSIGKFCMCDRKNLAMQRNIVVKHQYRYCVVSNAYMPSRPFITRYDFGSITDEQKAELMSKSKFMLWTSFIEGFGMPVLEAMAVGLPVIYTDVPAHNEFAVGIPIKPVTEIKSFCYGLKIIKYVIDEKDVEEAINYAMGMGKEEWENMSAECKEKAKKIYEKTVTDVLNMVERGLQLLIDRKR